MGNWKPKQSDIGKRVTFLAITRWSGSPATRIIHAVKANHILVRYGGWCDFYVKNSEIIKIHREDI